MLSERDERAAKYFSLSADYDLLRFRAPSVFNQIIRELASNGKSTFLVDSEETFRQDTSDGMIGAQHMLEHLHPTPRGYFLIGDAFYHRLLDNNVFSNLATATTDKIQARDIESAWRSIPLSEVDLMVGAYKIKTLTSDYPFTDIKQPVAAPEDKTTLQQIAKRRIEGESWLSTQQTLLTVLQEQGNLPEAAKAAGLLHDALPSEAETARVASLLYLQINELGLGEYYARRALDISTHQGQIIANYYLTLAEIVFKSGNLQEALSILDDLLLVEPDNQRALAIKRLISD
jgi:hypothetical protein